MRWCTSATARNARPMAACRNSCAAPLAAISTKVPSSGCARRTLLETGVIQCEEAFDALRHVARREGGARDVANVLIELEGIPARLADELSEPAAIADLAAVRFAIFQDLDVTNLAARIERDRVVDHQMLADH